MSATGTLIDPKFEPTFKLLVLAVAVKHRGQGGDVADECIHDALSHMEQLARAAGATRFLVIGYVDPRNVASQRMCQRNHFARTGRDGEYEVWQRLISVSEEVRPSPPRARLQRHHVMEEPTPECGGSEAD